MQIKHAIILSLSTILISIMACGDKPTPSTNTEPRADNPAQSAAENTQPRHDRLIGIAINEGETGDYERAFNLAMDSGIDFVSLPIFWDEFETSPETYAPETNWLEIANTYYSAANLDVALVVAPIDTTVVHTPEDLRAVPFDDPEMIRRFQLFLDYVLEELTEVDLVSISIGNEVDAFLGPDRRAWDAYEAFFAATSKYLHESHPQIKVGVKFMYDGLVQTHRSEIRAINQNSDVILVTYYPLKSDFSVKKPDVVFEEFSELTSVYETRPIYFLEIGFPSDKLLGSSEELQAEFIENVFMAWDQHQSSIKVMNFTWLHDIPATALDYYSTYYGIYDSNFLAYLSSLGLRNSDGSAKIAFDTLQQETSTRGW